MSEAQALLLGALAGLTILLGMPLGRRLRGGPALLVPASCGVLVYLLGDMLARAFLPLQSALLRQYDNLAGAAPVVWLCVAFLGGLVLGYGGLTAYLASASTELQISSSAPAVPTAVVASPGKLALLLAVGAALHNLGEGLALGNLAGNDWISINVVLAVGFVLQNLVAGSAIVAPFAGAAERPRWSYLLGLGLLAGVPMVLGTYLGWWLVDTFTDDLGPDLTSTAVSALAAGAILFVLVKLLTVIGVRGLGTARHVALLSGLVLAFLTEVLIIGASGA